MKVVNSCSLSPEETSVDMKEELTPADTGFESWCCDKLPLLFSRGLVSETAIRLIFVVRRRKKKKTLVAFTHDILKTVRRFGMSSKFR